MPLLIGMVGICYVVAFAGFWSLARMSAKSNEMVKERAKVVPFHRN